MKTYHLLLIVSIFFANAPTASAQDADKWDVSEARGQTEDVSFETSEGTWMNLDVSPDGLTIVFDMLGDIYTVPISGGSATVISSGQAFEVQPRFSPDGSRISFTSDRAGGDNIWTMNIDGSDPVQVTNESFRLLNNATWTPDGQYIIARKHFTSTRSLGAGEMWMYHAAGGMSGIQLTKRKNDQQDAGEPVVTADGKYLLYSEDVYPGGFFQYNKDPNSTIYVIKQKDLQTGEVKTLISGNGGSARPQPSPDGQHIAFVRRVREKSVLFLYDRESGAQTKLYDKLNHDQQEAWAIFGVYPNFSWTPDGKNIIFWAGGKIHTLDVASKSVAEIPFTAEVNITVSKALRFKQEVSPDEFTVKMIRDAVTSPDGSTLIFSALGRLYKKALPNGTPERLTSGTNLEYEPAFSVDGSKVVFTTWNDVDRGAIVMLDLVSNTQTTLTIASGYYFEPQFSPDGQSVVYRRGGGNSAVGYLYGSDRGLYRVAAEADAIHHKITDEGYQPRFNADGTRIYFMTGGGLSKKYNSISLIGTEKFVHFDLKYVNGLVPSPDGNWVAFTELHNAYIAPFPQSGTTISLSKDTKAIPVTRVTRDAGTYLHWSNNNTLHWMIGPEYFSRSVQQSFAFVDGAPSDLPEPDESGLQIGLIAPTDVPAGRTALTNARVISMNGDEVLENATIIVSGNRITQIAHSDSITIPENATVVNLAGKTIMPGMVDGHAHTNHFGGIPYAQQNWAYYANLAYGVTTIHDPSATTAKVFSQAELVRAGEMVGPRIYSTGTILYGADGDFKAVINSLDDARSHLRRMKAVGAFSVKSYNQPRREQRQQVLQAARELEMMVVPEGGSTFYHNMTMIIDGHTSVEHNLPVAPLYDDVIKVWTASETAYTPTLVVVYGGPSGENYWYQHTEVWNNEKLLEFVPRSVIDARSRRRIAIPEEEYYHMEVAASAKKLSDAGGLVELGAHGQLQGLGAHWELWMFVQGGMSPHQALRAATLNGATFIGLDDDIGSIEVGKLADLMIMDENPLDDIRNSESVSMVMINGRLYDASTMHEIGAHPNERDPFWWQQDGASDNFDSFTQEHTIEIGGAVCSCGRGH